MISLPRSSIHFQTGASSLKTRSLVSGSRFQKTGAGECSKSMRSSTSPNATQPLNRFCRPVTKTQLSGQHIQGMIGAGCAGPKCAKFLEKYPYQPTRQGGMSDLVRATTPLTEYLSCRRRSNWPLFSVMSTRTKQFSMTDLSSAPDCTKSPFLKQVRAAMRDRSVLCCIHGIGSSTLLSPPSILTTGDWRCLNKRWSRSHEILNT